MQFAQFALNLPKKLGLVKESRILLYFPDYQNIKLNSGKHFDGGLYSITADELKTLAVEFPEHYDSFQFLIIAGGAIGSEWTAQGYFHRGIIKLGVFLTASYKIADNNIELSAKVLEHAKDCSFEVSSLPKGIRIARAESDGNGVYELTPKLAENFKIPLPSFPPVPKLNISIVAINKSNPRFPSHFNLIIPFQKPVANYKKQFKSFELNIAKILKEIVPIHGKYILSITGKSEFCVSDSFDIGGKWIVNPESKSVQIHAFDTESKTLDLNLHFIIASDKVDYVSISRRISFDLSKAKIMRKDYAKCLSCANRRHCAQFEGFMNYIGHSTVLRQIAFD